MMNAERMQISVIDTNADLYSDMVRISCLGFTHLGFFMLVALSWPVAHHFSTSLLENIINLLHCICKEEESSFVSICVDPHDWDSGDVYGLEDAHVAQNSA